MRKLTGRYQNDFILTNGIYTFPMFFHLELSDTFMSALVAFFNHSQSLRKTRRFLYNMVHEKLSELYGASYTLGVTSLLCI